MNRASISRVFSRQVIVPVWAGIVSMLLISRVLSAVGAQPAAWEPVNTPLPVVWRVSRCMNLCPCVCLRGRQDAGVCADVCPARPGSAFTPSAGFPVSSQKQPRPGRQVPLFENEKEKHNFSKRITNSVPVSQTRTHSTNKNKMDFTTTVGVEFYFPLSDVGRTL